MSTRERLQVRVNAELVLDAGTCEEGSESCGPGRLIRPPEVTLPYGLAEMLLITPSRWTVTEVSREVKAPGS